MAKKTSTTKKVKDTVVETPKVKDVELIVEEVPTGCDDNKTDNKDEIVTVEENANVNDEAKTICDRVTMASPLEDVLDTLLAEETIGVKETVSTEPSLIIPTAEELSLRYLKMVENPTDRFIQDVCNILKITRLKKVEGKKTSNTERKKFNSITMWKW